MWKRMKMEGIWQIYGDHEGIQNLMKEEWLKKRGARDDLDKVIWQDGTSLKATGSLAESGEKGTWKQHLKYNSFSRWAASLWEGWKGRPAFSWALKRDRWGDGRWALVTLNWGAHRTLKKGLGKGEAMRIWARWENMRNNVEGVR